MAYKKEYLSLLKVKKRMKYLSLLLCFIGSITVQGQITKNDKNYNPQYFSKKSSEISNALIKGFENNNYKIVDTLFNPHLLLKLDANRTEQTWKSIEASYGSFKNIGSSALKETAEANFFLIELHFEHEDLDLELSLDENDQVNSLMLLPASNKTQWSPPSYVNLESIIEKDTSVGKVDPLLAKWTFPENNSKKAIAVFVHGSGANDMNESLGPNQFFKDLAYGLASNGIASIRYNKRTYDYRNAATSKINELDIDYEVTNDAIEAVNMANEMGYEKVILIGHSLGGHLAPKIAENSTLNGVITLAGNSSPFIDLIVPQYEYLIQNDSNTQITEFMLNAIKTQTKKVKDGDYDETTNAFMLPFSLPGKYWKSLEGYSPVKVSKKQDIPYLILNGDRDYQVTVAEAEQWKNGNKNKNSKTIIYKGLNHLFYFGEGILLPSEYEKVGHIDLQVITDISTWIKSL
ncbi:MAG: alpha/beta fold hydrolase [Bacteroidetes bacterium]|nr:alpha/beta fold hydrolase [Bacteroidota bacterium]NOG57725.1 alpha/beta fold hydrolase [Bacteroidota bacterium]